MKESKFIVEHIGIITTKARIAIITGDMERVPKIASLITSQNKKITAKRGFTCYECQLDEIKVLVISAGIGAPSTAIVVEELIELGIELIIRLGTCGAIQRFVHVGDFVVPLGIVRDEGTSAQYIRSNFPAIPDHDFLNLLICVLKKFEFPYHKGITHSKDSYYLEKPDKQINPSLSKQIWDDLKKTGVLATDMESSVIFIIGSLRGIRTSSILINVGSDMDEELFNKKLKDCVDVVKEAVLSFTIAFPNLKKGQKNPEVLVKKSYLQQE